MATNPLTMQQWFAQGGRASSADSGAPDERAYAKYVQDLAAQTYGVTQDGMLYSPQTSALAAAPDYEQMLASFDPSAKGGGGTYSDLPSVQMSPERIQQIMQGSFNSGGDFNTAFRSQLSPQEAGVYEAYQNWEAPTDHIANFLQMAMLGGFGALVAPSLMASFGGEAAGGFGGGAGGGAGGTGMTFADSVGLAQMGEAAGLTGDALASFVAQGGSAAGVGTGAASGWQSLQNLLTPSPQSLATTAASQALGGDAGGEGWGGAGTNERLAQGAGELAEGPPSAWSQLLNAFGLGEGSGGNLMPLGNLLGGLIGAGTGLYGANVQADAARQAAANQMSMFNTINQQQAPWRQAGQNALSQIGGMSDYFNHQFNNQDLQTHLAPNYQFQLQEGLRATNNAMNLQSGWSGNTLRGINDYAQNYAGGAYQNAFNNYQAQQNNIFNRLANIAGLGQTATAQTGNAGTQLAGQAGTATQNAGTAWGGGIVGAGNAVGGGINNALGWYSLPSILNGSYS